MEMMTIHLSGSCKEFVESQVAAGKYANPSAVVEDLVAEAKKRETNQVLERLLDEGMANGPEEPWTKEDWKQIRDEVHRRDAQRNGIKT